MTSDFVLVGKKADFPANRTTAVKISDKDICVAHAVGNFYAFDDSCTHAAAPLSESPIEDGLVTCPLHGATFSVSTGQAIRLPAVEPVKMYDVKIEGENVYVKVDDNN